MKIFQKVFFKKLHFQNFIFYCINILNIKPPVCCHLFVVVWGIAYLIDLDSYADWSFILLIGTPKSDRLKDRGQTK